MLRNDWRLYALHVGEQYGAIAHCRHTDTALDTGVQELDPANPGPGAQQPCIAPADNRISIVRLLDGRLERLRDDELHARSGRLQILDAWELQIADDDLARAAPAWPLTDRT